MAARDPEPDLDGILDALESSYAAPLVLNRLQTEVLPEKAAVIAAFDHLRHLMCMGCLSPTAVAHGSLRGALASHLRPLSRLMTEQIQRAVAYRDRDLPTAERRGPAWASEVVGALLRRLPELRASLSDDVLAAWNNDPAAQSIEEVAFSYPGVFAVSAYRVAHALYQLDVPMIPRILTEHAHSRTGIDIHPGARIGRRFFIDHGTGVVIGATTEIGEDVKLYQGVTLGALSVRVDPGEDRRKQVKRHPTLHDRVTVYAGATILGGATLIGHDAVIGGNVWLTASVPPHGRVVHRPRDVQA